MSGPTLFEHPIAMSSTMSASCPRCGTDILPISDAHSRIIELESQVRILNSKASAAVDKLADYEDEVHSLRAQCARLQQQAPPTPSQQTPDLSRPSSQPESHSSPPRAASRLASLSSFLPGRRKEITSIGLQPAPTVGGFSQSTPTLAMSPTLHDGSPPPTASGLGDHHPPSQFPNLHSLETSLEKERTLRLRAESSLTQTQTELEELTASLFGQANEMVATERRARAKLEERVKTLETRDGEKRRRLERLEKAMQRIERIRGLVERRNTVAVVNGNEFGMIDADADNDNDINNHHITSKSLEDKIKIERHGTL